MPSSFGFVRGASKSFRCPTRADRLEQRHSMQSGHQISGRMRFLFVLAFVLVIVALGLALYAGEPREPC